MPFPDPGGHRVELLAILGGSLLRLQDIDGAELAITQAVDGKAAPASATSIRSP
ncbi:MAG: hypothetical protein R2708_07875 [Vicinamibacterales bacterium]